MGTGARRGTIRRASISKRHDEVGCREKEPAKRFVQCFLYAPEQVDPGQASLSAATPLPGPASWSTGAGTSRAAVPFIALVGNTGGQERGLLERLERDAHEAGSARDRPQHDTLPIEEFQLRPGAGLIAVIAQRHFEADLGVLNHLGRVDVVEDVPHRRAEPPVAKVAPDLMGQRVRRTCGGDTDFAWHRAEDGPIGVERVELFEAGGVGGEP